MATRYQILSNGPKSKRWIDRAEWLYYVADERGNEAHTKVALQSLRHFVEAQDLRRSYESCAKNPHRTTPISHLKASAAKEHRQGVKHYMAASDLIFGKHS